jgi:alkylhydroperoxidase/carboxymuconolactone decarboxylase family protein YurZ
MGQVAEILRSRTASRERMEREAPALSAGFYGLMKEFYKPGALDRKTKE